jgi:3-hydroxyacyl-CoA dehydrogenase
MEGVMRQTLKIGITILVIATMASAGVALAQTSDSEAGAPDGGGWHTRIVERLQPLIDDGTITEDQAEAVAAALADGAKARRPHPLVDAAEFLGLAVEDLREALEDGATLGEIAEDNGSSTSDLVDFFVGKAEERLDQAVANGKIDESEKAEALARITERITDMVNGELPERPRRPNRAGRRGPGSGPGIHHGPFQGGEGFDA